MHKLVITLALILSAFCASAAPKVYELESPDGRLKLTVKASNGIRFTLKQDMTVLLQDCRIGMTTDAGVFGGLQSVWNESRRVGDKTFLTVAYKKSHVDDFFNEMVLRFNMFSLVFHNIAHQFAQCIIG